MVVYTPNMEQDAILSQIEDTLSRVIPTSSKSNYKCVGSKTGEFFLVSKKLRYTEMGKIAEALSSSDIVVEYVAGSNYLTLCKNPEPTPAEVPTISRIPATLDECVTTAKLKGLHVIDETVSGTRRITLVGTDGKGIDFRKNLTQIAYELSERGLCVSYVESNFLIVTVPNSLANAENSEIIVETAV